MNYILPDGSGRPLYWQLYACLRNDIVSGVYPHGHRLPSKRLLTEELHISPVTVEHAYALLCDEGYAEARERSGCFVTFQPGNGFFTPAPANPKPGTAPAGETGLPAGGEEADISCGFSAAQMARTMRRTLNESAEKLLSRTEPTGSPELREALRTYLARSRGLSCTAEQIVIGAGAEYLYGQILRLLGTGRRYAIESPSYHMIEKSYRAAGVAYEQLPLGPQGIETGALASTLASVLHVTPYRSFPSFITASASKRYEYVRWASPEGRYLIEDDYESEFSVSGTPEETLYALSPERHVIYMNTFSQTIAPSLRAAYMVLPENLLPAYRDRLAYGGCPVPTFEQLFLTSVLQSGEFERHINRVRRAKRRLSRP